MATENGSNRERNFRKERSGVNDSDESVLSDGRNRSLCGLAILAFLSSILYATVLLFSSDFAFGSIRTERPIIPVLLLFAAEFILYLFAIRFALKTAQTGRLLKTIVGSAVVFRFILLFSTPIQEIDIYRYLWDGAVCAEGVSPFLYSPERVRRTSLRSVNDPQLTKLIRLRDSNREISTVLNRIHHEELPTIYPPVSQFVFATVAISSPAIATVNERVFAMKCWLTGFDLATLFLVIALLKRCGKPLGLCTIYAWCPLLIKEVANSGHLDSISVFLTTLAVYFFVRLLQGANTSSGTKDRIKFTFPATGTAVVLALAVGAKLYAVVLAPLFFLAILKNFGWRQTVIPIFVFVLTSLVLLWPMRPQTAQNSDPFVSESQSVESDPSRGLTTFLRRWEMNDFLFLIVVENAKPTERSSRVPEAWFSVVPNGIRTTLVEFVESRFRISQKEIPFFLTRAVTGIAFLAVAFILAWRAMKDGSPSSFCEAAFLTLAWFWFLCPTQNPWYWTWALPFLAFSRSRLWLGVAGIAMIYYLRFWLGYRWPTNEVLNTGYDGKLFFDFVVTWIEFAPWFVLLAVSWVARRHRQSQIES